MEFFTIMVSWQQGHIRGGGGGGGSTTPSTLKFFFGKSEEKVQRKWKIDGEVGGGTC